MSDIKILSSCSPISLSLFSAALELIEHLRAMGETNALFQMNTVLKRDTALATAAIYDSLFAEEDGTVPATFQFIENVTTGKTTLTSLKACIQRGLHKDKIHQPLNIFQFQYHA
ncbi:unnamed protein product [Lupinus luteus]|uniref:Uncharacterized protein n=1 Tax=Lupinus luteus TaxID=3873 RepID=A0AAV1XY05_LUPLU